MRRIFMMPGAGTGIGGGTAVAYSISGIVTDGVNNVSGVVVALGSNSATTGVGGSYTISGIAKDTAGTLTATKAEYQFSPKSISAMSGNLTAQNFVSPPYLIGGIPLSACVGAYHAVGAATLSASYINLAHPGVNDINPIIAPTWNYTDGWVSSATNITLDTGIYPIGSSWSMISRSSGINNVDPFLIGCSPVSSGTLVGFSIRPLMYGSVRYETDSNGAHFIDEVATITGGVLAIAAKKCYRDKVLKGTITDGNSGICDRSIYLMASNRASITSIKGKFQAAYIYNIDVSSYIDLLTDAINSLP